MNCVKKLYYVAHDPHALYSLRDAARHYGRQGCGSTRSYPWHINLAINISNNSKKINLPIIMRYEYDRVKPQLTLRVGGKRSDPDGIGFKPQPWRPQGSEATRRE